MSSRDSAGSHAFLEGEREDSARAHEVLPPPLSSPLPAPLCAILSPQERATRPSRQPSQVYSSFGATEGVGIIVSEGGLCGIGARERPWRSGEEQTRSCWSCLSQG